MASSGSGRFRDALSHRDFRLLASSYTIDQLGDWASGVVLLVYVFDRTGSPTYLAITTAVRWVPALFLSSYAGVLADRHDRAKVMRASALLSFFLAVGMAVVAAASGPIFLLLMFSGLLGLAGAPYGPAAGALTADAVPERDLASANALYALLESMTVVVGPLVGGLLLAAGAPAAGFSLNAISFLLAAGLVSRIRTRSKGDAGAAGESTATQLADGVRALTADAVARTLVLFMLLDTAIYGATSVLYIPVSVHVGSGSSGYGYLLAGQALGGVGAAALTNRLSGRRRLTPIIVGGMLLLALPFAVLAAVTNAALAFALQVIAGAGMIVIDILGLTALQRDLPRERLSRVLGLVDGLVLGACLAGSLGAAALLRATSLSTTLLIVGFGFSAVAVLTCRPLLAADRRSLASYAQMSERVAQLEALDLLAAASRPSLERMALAATQETVPAGHVVLREGDPADALWVVESGSLAASIDGVVVNTVAAGDYVGEIGLLHNRPRTATVVATEPCVLLRIPAEDFAAAIEPVGPSTSLRNLAASRLGRRPSQSAAQSQLEPR